MKIRIIAGAILLVACMWSCNEEDALTPPTEVEETDSSQKAFPAAEGYGAYSKGGRGGEVIYVTNLNDSGAGSFREAVGREGKRTVVFAVTGIIELQTLIVINNPYLTIAGQTAPGNGITLKNSGLYLTTHDVIIRHIRIRPGDSENGHSFEDRDALTVGQESYNIMIDHVSASWAVDEIFSVYYAPHDITFQWCIIAEGLSNSKHPEGEHSKALLIGDNSKRVSIHHNVFAHNNDRCPVQAKGGSLCDVVNNYIYNWGEYALSFAITSTAEVGVTMNVMNNHFQKGLSTTGTFFQEPDAFFDSKIYIHDNSGDDELLIDYNTHRQSYIEAKEYLVSNPIEFGNSITVHSMATFRDSLLAYAGATLPKPDAVDTRIIHDIKNTTGTIIDSPDDVGGYPAWEQYVMTDTELLAYDSDKDGMPNDWEINHNLNPDNADDRNEDDDNDGYTNLEEFLNSK